VPGQYSFSRAERLTHKSEYKQVFEHGEKSVGRYFVCYWLRRESPGSKLGMAVSRKVGKAVVRNRIKRYIREFYRTNRPDFSINADLVIVARPECSRLCYLESMAALRRTLQRGGVMHG
jgi:ribonuclease P protein component